MPLLMPSVTRGFQQKHNPSHQGDSPLNCSYSCETQMCSNSCTTTTIINTIHSPSFAVCWM